MHVSVKREARHGMEVWKASVARNGRVVSTTMMSLEGALAWVRRQAGVNHV